MPRCSSRDGQERITAYSIRFKLGKERRNIPATLKRLSSENLGKSKQNIRKHFCAGYSHEVYEYPAQVGFPEIATALQLRLNVARAARSVIRLCRGLHRSLPKRLFVVRFLDRWRL